METNMAAGGSLIYGLMLKTVCGGSWYICERVTLKGGRGKRNLFFFMMFLSVVQNCDA